MEFNWKHMLFGKIYIQCKGSWHAYVFNLGKSMGIHFMGEDFTFDALSLTSVIFPSRSLITI